MFFETRKKKIYALNALKRLQLRNIHVLDINIDLQTRNKIVIKSNSSKGFFSGYENLIVLNKSLEYDEIQRVLYHEYGHAIDLFIGLHEYFQEEENYFYSDKENVLLKKINKSALRTYLSKIHSKESLNYYTNKNEIFPELLCCYLTDMDMPNIFKEFVEEYIKLFNKHVKSYEGINLINSINLSYRNKLPKLDNILTIKDKTVINKEKYSDLFARFE